MDYHELRAIGQTTAVAVLLFMGMAGCVAVPHAEPVATKTVVAPPGFPRRLAVLPVSNQAGNPDGAMIARAFAVRKLGGELTYVVQAPADTDGIIRDRTLSGPEVPVQVAIGRMDMGTLAAWLGVDGIIHGELKAYQKAKLSVYTRSEVKMHFWLTDAKGKSIWDAEKDSSSGSFGGGGSGSAGLDSALAGSGIPPEIMDRIHQSDLAATALDVIDEVFASYPRRN